MATPISEPTWLDRPTVLAIHDELLAQHGGLAGVRDIGLLDSALGRPQHRWAYDEGVDLFECAACYGFGIAKNHPFNDGNKRTAFQAMYTFLGLNGEQITAPDLDVVNVMVAVASGAMTEKKLADWLRSSTAHRPRRRSSRRKT
ncbi:MAG TPA: type II toxin-antitoxin system death-on-curing family toxin [Gemmatimonadales bacterium]|jgi:death-on-curing protein